MGKNQHLKVFVTFIIELRDKLQRGKKKNNKIFNFHQKRSRLNKLKNIKEKIQILKLRKRKINNQCSKS